MSRPSKWFRKIIRFHEGRWQWWRRISRHEGVWEEEDTPQNTIDRLEIECAAFEVRLENSLQTHQDQMNQRKVMQKRIECLEKALFRKWDDSITGEGGPYVECLSCERDWDQGAPETHHQDCPMFHAPKVVPRAGSEP